MMLGPFKVFARQIHSVQRTSDSMLHVPEKPVKGVVFRNAAEFVRRTSTAAEGFARIRAGPSGSPAGRAATAAQLPDAPGQRMRGRIVYSHQLLAGPRAATVPDMLSARHGERTCRRPVGCLTPALRRALLRQAKADASASCVAGEMQMRRMPRRFSRSSRRPIRPRQEAGG